MRWIQTRWIQMRWIEMRWIQMRWIRCAEAEYWFALFAQTQTQAPSPLRKLRSGRECYEEQQTLGMLGRFQDHADLISCTRVSLLPELACWHFKFSKKDVLIESKAPCTWMWCWWARTRCIPETNASIKYKYMHLALLKHNIRLSFSVAQSSFCASWNEPSLQRRVF